MDLSPGRMQKFVFFLCYFTSLTLWKRITERPHRGTTSLDFPLLFFQPRYTVFFFRYLPPSLLVPQVQTLGGKFHCENKRLKSCVPIKVQSLFSPLFLDSAVCYSVYSWFWSGSWMSRTLLIFLLRRGAQYCESLCTQSIVIPRTDRLSKTPNCFPLHLYNNTRLFYFTFSLVQWKLSGCFFNYGHLCPCGLSKKRLKHNILSFFLN